MFATSKFVIFKSLSIVKTINEILRTKWRNGCWLYQVEGTNDRKTLSIKKMGNYKYMCFVTRNEMTCQPRPQSLERIYNKVFTHRFDWNKETENTRAKKNMFSYSPHVIHITYVNL